MTNPAFPCYAGVLSSVKSIMQELLLPQVCKDRGYTQSWHAQVWPWRKMRKTKQSWGNSLKGAALFSGQPLAGIRMSLVPRVSPDAAGATGARCRKGLGERSGCSREGCVPWCSAEFSCMCLHRRSCSGFLFYISMGPVPFVNRGAERHRKSCERTGPTNTNWRYI